MHQNPQRRISQSKRAIDLDRISWDDLRVFVVAARHSSFRKASLVANLSAATVTRRVDALEQQFGVRLFDRLPDGVRLTREGQWVLSAAQKMEQASTGLRRFLDQDPTARGVIRCAITEGLGTFWVLPKLVEFNRANPYSIVDLRCTMDFADVIRMEADVAVQLVRPTNPDLKVVKLGRLHIGPYAARRYLETFGAPQTKAEVVRHRIVDQVSPQIPRGTLEDMLGLDTVEGVVALRTNASSSHYYGIEQGIGIGVLPSYAVPLGANVIPLDIDIYRPQDIWLTYHPAICDVPRIRMFIDWMRDIFDPAKYPWFQDNYIHPRELDLMRAGRPGSTESTRSIAAPSRLMEPESRFG